MDLSTWEWLILVSRWLVYLCVSSAVGGAASLYFLKSYTVIRLALWRYTITASVMGFMITSLHFFIRVGALSSEGIVGMFDPFVMDLLWGSTVGDATAYRLVGFSLLIASMIGCLRIGHSKEFKGCRLASITLSWFGCLVIAVSFTKTGHIAEMGAFSAALLIVHVVLTVWWMGSLYPLWLSSRLLSAQDLYIVMHRFGQIAVAVVIGLVICGAVLSYQITGWTRLFSSDYGFWLLLKLALVGFILLLAGVHKLFLVPAIQANNNARSLARSLLLEKVVGASILGITTVLTTLVGPAH